MLCIWGTSAEGFSQANQSCNCHANSGEQTDEAVGAALQTQNLLQYILPSNQTHPVRELSDDVLACMML